MELPETLLGEYIFVSANNPTNIRHGGEGLFYKNSLPVIVRNDLSFDKSIVVELKFGNNFFLLFYIEILFPTIPLLYFKPSWHILKIYTPKSKLKNLLQHIFTGDFNAHTQLRWPDGDIPPEGSKLWRSFYLTRTISAHFWANKFWAP